MSPLKLQQVLFVCNKRHRDLIYVLEQLLWLPFGDWIIERKNEEVTRDGMTVVTQGRDGGGLD